MSGHFLPCTSCSIHIRELRNDLLIVVDEPRNEVLLAHGDNRAEIGVKKPLASQDLHDGMPRHEPGGEAVADQRRPADDVLRLEAGLGDEELEKNSAKEKVPDS